MENKNDNFQKLENFINKDINDFEFINPGKLIDEELELNLAKTVPQDDKKGYVPSYEFDMINRNTGEKMGEIRVRIGNNENIRYLGHIGANIDKKFRGNRYALRALKLLFPFVKKHNLGKIIITCNPENIATRKTCELAGGKFLEIIDIPKENNQYEEGERKKCIYEFEI